MARPMPREAPVTSATRALGAVDWLFSDTGPSKKDNKAR